MELDLAIRARPRRRLPFTTTARFFPNGDWVTSANASGCVRVSFSPSGNAVLGMEARPAKKEIPTRANGIRQKKETALPISYLSRALWISVPIPHGLHLHP